MQKGTEYGDAIRCRVFFRLFALGLGILRVMGFSVPQVVRCRASRRGGLLGYQKAKVPEIIRFRGLLARREGFEPPAFWSVGCLKHKSEPFRLRFVLFAAVYSADLPLFPSVPVRFFRILGQKWVRHGALAPTPTASHSPSRRRRQQDRPRRPHHSCSPAEYR